MIVFWLGVLTGALVVGFVFFRGSLAPGEYQSSFLKGLGNASLNKAPVVHMNKLPATKLDLKGKVNGITPHGMPKDKVSGITPHGMVNEQVMGITPHGMVK